MCQSTTNCRKVLATEKEDEVVELQATLMVGLANRTKQKYNPNRNLIPKESIPEFIRTMK